MQKSISINLVDTEDNYPVNYKVSSVTTKGSTRGWHLVELLDETFDKEFTFRYAMLDQFISALLDIKKHLEEN